MCQSSDLEERGGRGKEGGRRELREGDVVEFNEKPSVRIDQESSSPGKLLTEGNFDRKSFMNQKKGAASDLRGCRIGCII